LRRAAQQAVKAALAERVDPGLGGDEAQQREDKREDAEATSAAAG
jgi:hypothetical protein